MSLKVKVEEEAYVVEEIVGKRIIEGKVIEASMQTQSDR